MKILVLGGTRFVGRHLVDAALTRGHQVTLFNRGQSNPGLFPQVETILGDREKDLARLAGRSWETVIDTNGYVPRLVRLSAEALKGAARSYIFISSISVYASLEKIGVDENDPVGKIEDETVEEVGGGTYGPLKALCERAVQDVFGDGALIVRPGLIVGPHDPTDRFTYWPARVARGGQVLAPDRPGAPTQIVDVRDLAGFVIHLAEGKTSGMFNATGPDYTLTFGKLLDTCKQVSGSDADFKWASVEFLEQNKVSAWSDLPAWLPERGEDAGFAFVNISKAMRAGLAFRPLEDTVRDTLAWAKTRPAGHEWRAGLKPDREVELLKSLNS
jgi:2'-hydroxyisoflavone reductase